MTDDTGTRHPDPPSDSDAPGAPPIGDGVDEGVQDTVAGPGEGQAGDSG